MSENKGDLISREAQHTSEQKAWGINPEIIVAGTAEKPYYHIRYFCEDDGKIHIGFGSFKLSFVFDWLKEYFSVSSASIVDAVEFVRCKDCRYSRGMNDAEQKLYLDDVLICTSGDMGTDVEFPVFQNDYCSYGERKDGADNG